MKDHEHAGFSWYPTSKPDVFNPYKVSDRISRKTWYDNITYPDMIRNKLQIKKVTKIQDNTLHLHSKANISFTALNCPECAKN